MEPFDRWLSSFSVVQLRPFGQIPETESFSRRNSLEINNTVSLARVFVDLPITNQGRKARMEVISMEFDPPLEVGGMSFRIVVPAWWWGAQKLTPEDVRGALRGEIEARLQGRPPEEIFMRNYISELRTDIEECARTLPATLFAPLTEEDLEYAENEPLSVSHGDWLVTRHIISEKNAKMNFQRRDVSLDVSLPLTVLHQSPGAAQDWVLMQVCL